MNELNCIFCKNCNSEENLIELHQNALEFDGVIIEFSSIIEELFLQKVRNIETALICETCKDLLVQFYVFSENIKNNREDFIENGALIKCQNYLNECSEDISCIRYNEALMLVPKSKLKLVDSWKIFESIENTNFEEINDQELGCQIEEIETPTEIKIEETLKDHNIIETEEDEIEIKVTDDDYANISTSVLDYSISDTQKEEEMIVDYDIDYCDSKELDQLFYSCVKCNFISESQEEHNQHIATHMISSSKRYCKLFCSKCSYQFTTQAHFTAHNNGHKLFDTVSKYMNYPKCETCNMMFVDEDSCEIHIKDHKFVPIESIGFFLKFGIKGNDQEEDTVNDENSVVCGHCLKKKPNDEELTNHLLIFHAKVLTCPIDLRNFNNNQAFSVHMRNNHAELFPDSAFICSLCKTEFESLYDKLSHMRNCKEKSFNCLHCSKSFARKCHLMKHLKLVSGELNITCEICSKVCRDKHDHAIHIRSHSNEKLFQCSLCEKSYKTSSARAAHLQSHLEIFSCPHCSSKFKSRRTMQKHIKNKHAKESSINNMEEIEIY